MANQSETTRENREGSGRMAAGLRALTAPQKRGYLVAAVLACLLLVVSAVGGLLAKYVSQNRQEAEMISAGFHISSDYLKESTASVDVATTGEIRVELYNWEVENTAQVAEMDIGYQVVVQDGVLASVTLNDTTTQVRPTSGVYTLSRGEAADGKTKHVLHINPSAGTETVTVTVKNTTPYQKNGESGLSAVFTRTVAANPTYTLTQHTAPDVWKLTIKTYGYSGAIKIQCNIAPDNTNDNMPVAQWTTGGTGTLTVQDNETYELLFFGTAEAVGEETAIPNPGTVGISVGTAPSGGD